MVSLTAFLDLSATCERLDHSILLKRLEITFGVRDSVFHWFSSYVSEWFQSIIVNGSVSDHCPLLYGLLQGSVLDQFHLLFILSLFLTSFVSTIVRSTSTPTISNYLKVAWWRTSSVLICLFNNVSLLFRVVWIVIRSCLMSIKQRFWLWVPPLALKIELWHHQNSRLWHLVSEICQISWC